MLLSWIWLGMMAASLLYGCLTGRAGALLPAALDGASSAVSLSLRLMAGYVYFHLFLWFCYDFSKGIPLRTGRASPLPLPAMDWGR